ncbi:hypothetical protein BpHYR1_009238 [Brachionus plicatilis]|uniref:Uncharacterized protein n=1 Tax=Brachionus plicatilis TaxID=10195 RepID=A0A3M7PY16_BRAPC|nr:hypothetical protein BpHYR1_009238 [Brachionus plicatilis]
MIKIRIERSIHYFENFLTKQNEKISYFYFSFYDNEYKLTVSFAKQTLTVGLITVEKPESTLYRIFILKLSILELTLIFLQRIEKLIKFNLVIYKMKIEMIIPIQIPFMLIFILDAVKKQIIDRHHIDEYLYRSSAYTINIVIKFPSHIVH